MPQPNSGRIGRSPGAVPMMIWIASSMSASSLTSASPPLRSIRRGNATPVPRKSDNPFPLAQRDHAALERQSRVPLHGDVWSLDRQGRARLHRHACNALDGHVALAVDRDVADRAVADLALRVDREVALRAVRDLAGDVR